MKMRITYWFLVVATITAVHSCTTAATKKAQPETSAEMPKLPVDAIIASSSVLSQSELISGSIAPNREVEIMSLVTRKIVDVSFRDGDMVLKGQLLYKLDNLDILARIKQLNAELQLARINEKRFFELLKTETVRQEEYDAAFAKRLSLEASADLLNVELQRTFIRAPFSGKIGISKVQVGAIAGPGIAMATIQEQSIIKVTFSVSEKYVPMIAVGKTVYFSTELQDSMMAVITATEPGLDLQSRSIIVHAQAKNPAGRLKPGMSAKIFFTSNKENAKGIYIPTEALIPGANGYSVFIIKGGITKSTPVTITNRTEESALVTSGIRDGDTVMISNVLRAMDGTAVEIVNK